MSRDLRAEGGADADFARPLRHGIRQHAEQADAGDRQREDGEGPEQHRVEPRLREALGHAILHRHHRFERRGGRGAPDDQPGAPARAPADRRTSADDQIEIGRRMLLRPSAAACATACSRSRAAAYRSPSRRAVSSTTPTIGRLAAGGAFRFVGAGQRPAERPAFEYWRENSRLTMTDGHRPPRRPR